VIIPAHGIAVVRGRLAVALAIAGLALAGCSTDPTRAEAAAAAPPAASYPAPVPDFGRDDKFPLEVAGFRRTRVLTYAPGLVDYSIAYERRDATLDDVVTLYFYPRMNDAAAPLRHEEEEILQMHRDARVVSRRTLRLLREGSTYDAHVVNFEYDDLWHGVLRPLSAQLLIVFRAQGVFKARTAAPLAQAAPAEAAMLQLLQGVAWDAPEAFVGR
jgi:hypothetical protein